jgi:hypothetical protein
MQLFEHVGCDITSEKVPVNLLSSVLLPTLGNPAMLCAASQLQCKAEDCGLEAID